VVRTLRGLSFSLSVNTIQTETRNSIYTQPRAAPTQRGQQLAGELCELISRLDNLLTFSLIRFLHELFLQYMQENTIVLLSALVVLCCEQTGLAVAVSRIMALMWSQSVINIATARNRLLEVDDSLGFEELQLFAAATALLVLGSVLGSVLQHKVWMRQCVSLLLFMYAEATQATLSTLRIGYSLIFVCTLLYGIAFRARSVVTADGSTILQALQMICINTVLQTVDSNTSLHTSTGMLVLILLVVDAASSALAVMSETRDYTLWKVSVRLTTVFARGGLPVVLAPLALVVVQIVPAELCANTLRELVMLILFNSVIDRIAVPNMDVLAVQTAVAAFACLLIFRAVLRVLQ